MEHAPHTTPGTGAGAPLVSSIPGGMAAASIGLGFWSSIVFWWYPFGGILATVGLILGVISLARGVRGPRGENYALIGVLLCSASLSFAFTLNHVLRFLQWDTLPW